MLTTLLYLSFVMLVSAGNLAIGYGLAVHLGHGPSQGWRALCFWKRKPAADGAAHADHPPADAAAPAKPAAAHGH